MGSSGGCPGPCPLLGRLHPHNRCRERREQKKKQEAKGQSDQLLVSPQDGLDSRRIVGADIVQAVFQKGLRVVLNQLFQVIQGGHFFRFVIGLQERNDKVADRIVHGPG